MMTNQEKPWVELGRRWKASPWFSWQMGMSGTMFGGKRSGTTHWLRGASGYWIRLAAGSEGMEHIEMPTPNSILDRDMVPCASRSSSLEWLHGHARKANGGNLSVVVNKSGFCVESDGFVFNSENSKSLAHALIAALEAAPVGVGS